MADLGEGAVAAALKALDASASSASSASSAASGSSGSSVAELLAQLVQQAQTLGRTQGMLETRLAGGSSGRERVDGLTSGGAAYGNSCGAASAAVSSRGRAGSGRPRTVPLMGNFVGYAGEGTNPKNPLSANFTALATIVWKTMHADETMLAALRAVCPIDPAANPPQKPLTPFGGECTKAAFREVYAVFKDEDDYDEFVAALSGDIVAGWGEDWRLVRDKPRRGAANEAMSHPSKECKVVFDVYRKGLVLLLNRVASRTTFPDVTLEDTPSLDHAYETAIDLLTTLFTDGNNSPMGQDGPGIPLLARLIIHFFNVHQSRSLARFFPTTNDDTEVVAKPRTVGWKRPAVADPAVNLPADADDIFGDDAEDAADDDDDDDDATSAHFGGKKPRIVSPAGPDALLA